MYKVKKADNHSKIIPIVPDNYKDNIWNKNRDGMKNGPNYEETIKLLKFQIAQLLFLVEFLR